MISSTVTYIYIIYPGPSSPADIIFYSIHLFCRPKAVIMTGENGQNLILEEKRMNFVLPEIFIYLKNIFTGFGPDRHMHKYQSSTPLL